MKSQIMEGMMRVFIAERGMVMFVCSLSGDYKSPETRRRVVIYEKDGVSNSSVPHVPTFVSTFILVAPTGNINL